MNLVALIVGIVLVLYAIILKPQNGISALAITVPLAGSGIFIIIYAMNNLGWLNIGGV